ncbi:DNA repair protein RecO [Pararhodobacter zhoushanensis]|uniref:DNA repair protein RecO n=1 Tax=Pararhodobacter zhoushanensis TaxID=2479545 RepID=UPI000F8D55A5|nr:DNA repair protein RecO [Pararhodobacter zhoushanensis]
MDWTGDGILLSARPHGENTAIIEVLTAEHGLHRGAVRGGTGRKLTPVLQPGNTLALSWRARLDDHLGNFTVEPLRARASTIMLDAERLAALNALSALAVFALADRDPQPRLYALTTALLDRLAEGDAWFGTYLLWERLLLDETGYGLDLSACAVSGEIDGLAYVSPKTGRAVTAEAAGDWADRLLPLPPLLLDAAAPESREQMAQGLQTTGHFLREVLAPALGNKPLPQARNRLASRFAG